VFTAMNNDVVGRIPTFRRATLPPISGLSFSSFPLKLYETVHSTAYKDKAVPVRNEVPRHEDVSCT